MKGQSFYSFISNSIGNFKRVICEVIFNIFGIPFKTISDE